MKLGDKRREYNYGIEVLRIVSVFMVVILHILGRGGILESAQVLSPQYHVAWLLEIACYCAVNCYALISGYVMMGTEFKYSRYIVTWLQAFLYSIGITLIFMLWNSQTVDVSFFMKSLFPVLSRRWWYFTAYTGVYFLIPFLNILVNHLDERKLIALCVTLIILFSVCPTAVSRFWGDLFTLSNGYSMLWLTVLYLLGASYKKIQSDLSQKWRGLRKAAIIGWLSCIGITFLFHNVGPYLPERFPGKETLVNCFVSYTSPTILGIACCMLVLFSELQMSGNKWKKLVTSISRVSFSVYLIHVHPLVWDYFMNMRFAKLATVAVWKMVIGVIVSSLLIFIFCISIDTIRNQLFIALKIRNRVEQIGAWVMGKMSGRTKSEI